MELILICHALVQMSESLTAERAQSAVLQQQLKEMQQRTERAEERLSNLLQLPTALIELQLQMESLQKESTDTLTKHNTIAERLTRWDTLMRPSHHRP